MALVKLHSEGILKHLVSQNCDGLHRKSGFPPDSLSELHGNSNVEQCSECGKEYLRDYDTVASYQFSIFEHGTGRKCLVCGGELVDSIINFGEALPKDAIDNGFQHASKADLCLVLGSSLTVSPACEIPGLVGKNGNGNLVICNLQQTPYDGLALKINAKCDTLMRLVMEQLGLEIPPFIIHRRVFSEVTSNRLIVGAVDFDNTPLTLCPCIVVQGMKLEEEPFCYKLNGETQVNVQLNFFGHYLEPPLSVTFPCDQVGRIHYDLHYNPLTREWNVDTDQNTKKWVTFPNRPVRPLKACVPKNTTCVTGHSVEPKTDCPHVGGIPVGVGEFMAPAWKENSCRTCGDRTENWVCLACGQTYCSRYVHGHMSEHNQKEGHTIAVSFSDLSVWCYSCDDYIVDPFISRTALNSLHVLKFGKPGGR
eukprot:TRINITY_DN7218_c0_g2_i11.p1 TRINITY_DN7218_c0_g2~~TRINITY_DN7218_c0_g2_i11.p1  ORF type:complete len:422 (-),score=72.86 TRINITY_DN7218_c0_g2_i11:179-1444(-)